MSRLPDIWSRLQDYEVSPPRELFDKVCDQVKEDGSIGSIRRLEDHAIQPPAALRRSVEEVLFNKEVLNPEKDGQPGKNPNPAKDRNLAKDHKSTKERNPAKDHKSMKDRISAGVLKAEKDHIPGKAQMPAKTRTAGKGRRPIRWFAIRAAAACLVLGLAGWLLYRATVPQKTAAGAVTKNTTKIASGKDVSGALPVIDSLSKKDSLSTENSLAGSAGDDSGRVAAAGRYRQPLSFHMNGQSFPIVDNDLLVSWANFNYTEMPDFFNHAGSEGWKIHLDQYTNILVSKTMAGLMKEMNQFKANGNPTRRARRGREKLDKWKKADGIQFDRSLHSNPLDPIDLAEFIFK